LGKLKLYFPAIVWGLIIVFISSYPGQNIPKVTVWQFDKLVHSIIYAVFSICLLIACYKEYKVDDNRLKINIFVLFFGVFYGGIMEILQNNIFINRNGNWYDFIANTIGAIIGVLNYPLVIKYLPISRWLKIK